MTTSYLRHFRIWRDIEDIIYFKGINFRTLPHTETAANMRWSLGGHWGGQWVVIGWSLGGHWVVIGWSPGPELRAAHERSNGAYEHIAHTHCVAVTRIGKRHLARHKPGHHLQKGPHELCTDDDSSRPYRRWLYQ